jgi:hypothetical protein
MYNEHVKDIENNNEKTGYSHHILTRGYECGKFENTLEILNLQRSSTYIRKTTQANC